MRTLKQLFVVGASCALLVGCAAQSAKPNFVEVAKATEAETARVIYDPSAWIGVVETDAIRRGNFVSVETVLPYGLKEEFQLPRIRWIGLAVSETGVMHPIQFVWAGCSSQFGKLKMLAVIEGTTSLQGLRGIHFATLMTSAYGLDGRALDGFDAEKFRTDVAYQRDFVRANGTALEPMVRVGNDKVEKMFSSFWQMGDMLIPPSTDRKIAENIIDLNPAERFEQKYTATADMEISPSLKKTLAGAAVDVVRARMTPCFGWHKECRVTDEYYFAATRGCIARTTERSQP